MVARCSTDWEDAPGRLGAGNAISDRAVDLAQTDGRAWDDALLGSPRRRGGVRGRPEAGLRARAEARGRRGGAARDRVARRRRWRRSRPSRRQHCDATYRADAAAAAALAAGGAAAAAHLVRVNLGIRPADPRLARALASEQAAREVADRLGASASMTRYSSLSDAELVRALPRRRLRSVERARRAVLALRLRDRSPRLPPLATTTPRTSSRTSSRGSTCGSTRFATTRRFDRGSPSSHARRCLDALASKGRETQAEEDTLTAEESTDLTEVEEAFAVREALSGLSDNCQDILDRFFARDQSYKTIAEELEIPSGTIASRIARCLGRLREQLEGRNDTPDGSRG